jgi:uncharacterized protein (TIGR03085 family)
MSPLSVLMVTSNVSVGEISMSGAEAMAAYANKVPEPLDARERRELSDLLGDLGPDAPTLCEGWTTMDLAVHLVVRERRPQAAPGILFGGPFASLLARAEERMARKGYANVVELVRDGPPLVSPFSVPGLRTLVNLSEYAIHHEDVRRANGGVPRTDRTDLQAALWNLLRRGARLQLRNVDDTIVHVARTEGDTVTVGKAGPAVTITGDPLELSLYLAGRRGAALVDVTGDPDAVERLATAKLGV